ncbi:MAG: PAS domain S-box protein [Verrucomicrobia bacterium]|nr:PAS domain S-box protein [Verrucomicrobiota bacterium]
MEFLRNLFSSDGFMPHGHCYLWNPGVVWLHIASDALIALAYFSIPVTLGYFVVKRKDLAFHWMFLCFAVFIAACGTTHVMEIWSIYHPTYWLSGSIKALTALASVPTAILLAQLVPQALALPSPSQLKKTNETLEKEIAVRTQAESALAQSVRELDAKNNQLIAAERTKSEFFANVSHELRTPLTLILAPLESLLEKPDAAWSGEQRNSLRTIYNNAIRLLQMVTGLLDFSKLEAEKAEVNREPVRIVDLTRAVLGDFAPALKQKSQTLNFHSAPEEACVHLDRYLYERILFNLLSNAVKFTPQGGTISVSLTWHEDRLGLSVADTGIGIPRDELPHLFQKFRQLEGSSTRRFEGTGLGLALVQEFIQLLGGTVSVESAAGQGSTFTVQCPAPLSLEPGVSKPGASPVQRYELEPVQQVAAATAASEPRPKVLIAEDNTDLASYIASLLREACETKTAMDGEAALRLAGEWMPDLVLADVMMPGRDGLSVCRQLKRDPATARTPVILLTALTHREALLQGWEAGADEYLFKPFHQQELKTRIQTLLRATQAGRQAEEVLRNAKAELEQGVRARTLELAHSNAALQAEIAERTRAEETLRESEERYRSLVETLPEVVVLISTENATITSLNLPFEKKTGWPRAQWIGQPFTELLHSDDIEAAFAAFHQAARGEWPPRLELRFCRRSGEYLVGEVICGPHFQKGRVAGVFGCIRDVTQRKRDEIALRESEERFRQIAEHIREIFWMSDPIAGKSLYVSPAYEAIWGRSCQSLQESWTSFMEGIHPEDRERVSRALTRQINREATDEEYRVLRPDGTVRWVRDRAFPIQNSDGKVYRITGIAEDITARKQAEEENRRLNAELEQRVRERTAQLETAYRNLENENAERKLTEALLRESEERFRLLVLSIKDYAIFGLDPEGRVAGWNTGAERIKGYKAGEIIGQPISTFYIREDRERGKPQLMLRAAMEQGRVEDEGWRLRKDGTTFWANVVITALRDEDGQLRGFAEITRDITERKQAEEGLRQSQEALRERTVQLEAANKELEAFSYSVSHDLRAPLRAIDGFSQALQEDCADRLDEPSQKHLGRIREATRRMGQLIDGLLQLSRITRSDIRSEPVNLSELAEGAVEELKQLEPQRQVEFALQPGLVVLGDPRLLRVVLTNLLDNAWKFSRKNPQARVEFGMTEQDGQCVLFVRDNGAGFDMAYSDRLFGAFQRLHPKSEFEGTGIGLATVQRIVHRHGGQIWAEAAPNQGATFYFTLPISK